jgi:hypothetical protein
MGMARPFTCELPVSGIAQHSFKDITRSGVPVAISCGRRVYGSHFYSKNSSLFGWNCKEKGAIDVAIRLKRFRRLLFSAVSIYSI